MNRLVIDSNIVEEFSLAGESHVYGSTCLISRDGSGSDDLVLNRYRLTAGQDNGGGIHEVNDEAYYVLEGEAILTLGDRGSATPAVEYEVKPGTAAFIPAGTFHGLRVTSDNDLVILTMWPRQPVPKTNPIHDARVEQWGTSFRDSDDHPAGKRISRDAS
jgi:mannose-6-phosphate isomerase-like protein (cupin superfamily)